MGDRLGEIQRLLAEATPVRRMTDAHVRAGADGGPFYIVAASDAQLALANAAPELLGWAVAEIERLRSSDALSDAWCTGVNDALDGVPGGDEYASAITAHANALVNPYARRVPQ